MGPREEQGMVTAFVVGVVFALFLAVGLVYDGGSVLAARRAADNTAAAAARRAAQELDVEGLYRGGPIALDPGAAYAAADAVVRAAGQTVVEIVVDDREVTVVVGDRVPLSLLGAGGVVGPVEVRGRATARLAAGLGGT